MRRTRRQTVGSKMMHRTKQLSFAQSYQTIICHREPRAELRRSGTTKWRSLDKCIQVAAAHGQTNMLRYVQSIRLGHPSCVKTHAQECMQCHAWHRRPAHVVPVFGCEYFPSTDTCDMPIRAVRQTQTAGAITTPRAARPARGSAQTSTTTYDHCPFHKYVRTKMTKCRDIVLPAWLTRESTLHPGRDERALTTG